jgi:DNA polymerase-3 subunit delta'
MKKMVVDGALSPQFLREIGNTADILKRQVNHRLALEVMTLKHISYGGNGNWLK